MLTTVPTLIKAREFCIRYKWLPEPQSRRPPVSLTELLSGQHFRNCLRRDMLIFFRKVKIFLSFLPQPPHVLFPFHVFSFFLSSSFCCYLFWFIFLSAGCFPLFPLTSLSQIFSFDSCHRSFVELTCKVIKVENYF